MWTDSGRRKQARGAEPRAETFIENSLRKRKKKNKQKQKRKNKTKKETEMRDVMFLNKTNEAPSDQG